MASLWDNFKLGLAGVEDVVGIGDGHEAAETAAEQSAAQVAASGGSPEDVQAAEAAALQHDTTAEDNGALDQAEANTGAQVKSDVIDAAKTVGDVGAAGTGAIAKILGPLKWVIGAAVVLGLIYAGVATGAFAAIKAAFGKRGKK